MLTAQSSVAEVTAELKARKVRLQGSVGGADYPLDKHFELYCFDEFSTLDDIMRFVEHLESECPNCTKAGQIRSWLKDLFWLESLDRMKVVVAVARRTCCLNHETGSYAKRVL